LLRGQGPVIVWFRQDLRLADNAALAQAAASGAPILPVYVLDDAAPGVWRLGAASRWWLHYSLAALDAQLRKLGAPLVLLSGPAEPALLRIAEATGATSVCWNAVCEPAAAARDARLATTLRERGVQSESFPDALWREAEAGSAATCLSFSDFWRRRRAAPEAPLPAPRWLTPFAEAPEGEQLMAWRLTPTRPDWADGLRETWTPGERAAQERLAALADSENLHGDAALEAGSRLSPHVHFGELSSRQVWAAAPLADRPEGEAFLRRLGWREFARLLLQLAPDLPERSLKPDFDAMRWRRDDAALEAWRCGRTGYPLVDAGMRQLRRIGFMPNRVRMVAASFLAKHLLIDWREGERWFWDKLVDADLASNAMNWQWVAGAGADSAPYFRMINPVLQGEKFDPAGVYVRRWVAELSDLPDKYVHRPWEAPEDVSRGTGVILGETYPRPIVAHDLARRRALAAFKSASTAA
jgi:deoxyribodipyrimidine photo-lyase